MAAATDTANNIWLQQQSAVGKVRVEEGAQSKKSTSPTSAASCSSCADSSVGSAAGGDVVAGPSMAKESIDRESKEPVTDTAESTSAVKSTSGSIVASVEERCSNPDPDQVGEIDEEPAASSTRVVPSVIRVSPSTKETGTIESPRVVRPCALKTSPASSNGTAGADRVSKQDSAERSKRSEESVKQNGKGSTRRPPPAKGRKAPSDTPPPQIDQAKKRQEAQVAFPSHNKPQKRMPPTSGGRPAGAPQMDGSQAPAQHVQYSTGARQPHTGRQDTHGHRHGRGAATRATSVTSSVDGTPTMQARRTHHSRGMSASSQGGDESDVPVSPSIPPTPLFQRLVTEEVQELKHYTRIIEEQNRKLNEVENITIDLERKLQKQSKARTDLEHRLEHREREWSDKFEQLEKDRDRWKDVVEQEKRMNSRLNEKVARMEQEVHRMLARKYDHHRGENVTASVRGVRVAHNDRGSPSLMAMSTGGKPVSSSPPGHGEPKKETQFTSPREILENDGRVEVVRTRNISDSLLDFFGM